MSAVLFELGGKVPSAPGGLVFGSGSVAFNPIGELYSAGAVGALGYENFPFLKNHFREGAFYNGIPTLSSNGWPTEGFSFLVWQYPGGNPLPSWLTAATITTPFTCGFTYSGTGTPVIGNLVGNCTIGALTHTGSNYFFTIYNCTGDFGFTLSGTTPGTEVSNWFINLPEYPASAVDQVMIGGVPNPAIVTSEAIAHYSQIALIGMEWPSVCLYNTQIGRGSTRNTAANTQTSEGWGGSQAVNFGALFGTATGGTKNTLVDTSHSWATNQFAGQWLTDQTSAKTVLIISNTATTLTFGQTGATATGGSTTTLIDTSQAWPTNQWAGATVYDNASGLSATIASNTATTLTFSAIATAPVSGDSYTIGITAPASGDSYGIGLAIGATSGVLQTAWPQITDTFCLILRPNNFSNIFGRIASMTAGSTAVTFTGAITLATVVTAAYGLEGYPFEWWLALAVAANTGIKVGLPPFEDGTSGAANTYTIAIMQLIAATRAAYPAWTGKIVFTTGNEPWNGAYHTNYVFTQLAANYGFASVNNYWGYRMHALAQLGRTYFPSTWGTRETQVLEWQTGNGGLAFFEGVLSYMNMTYGAPLADVQWIAIAPYMNPTGLTSSSTTAQIVAATQANALTQAWSSRSENIAIAALYYGIPMMSYESNAQWSASTYSGFANVGVAVVDPSYQAAMQTYYGTGTAGAGLLNCGYKLVMHSTGGVSSGAGGGGGAGSMELTNNYDALISTGSPVFNALLSLIDFSPTRNVVSGPGQGSIILTSDYADAHGGANATFALGGFAYGPFYSPNGYAPFLINCEVAGTYTVSVPITGVTTAFTTKLQVGGDGSPNQVVSSSIAVGVGTTNLSVSGVPLVKGINYLVFGTGTVETGTFGNDMEVS